MPHVLTGDNSLLSVDFAVFPETWPNHRPPPNSAKINPPSSFATQIISVPWEKDLNPHLNKYLSIVVFHLKKNKTEMFQSKAENGFENFQVSVLVSSHELESMKKWWNAPLQDFEAGRGSCALCRITSDIG